MFNQLCAIIERHYSVPKLLGHLRDAVPIDYPKEIVPGDVYSRWGGPYPCSVEFTLPRPAVALQGSQGCAVVADYRENQTGLYGHRLFLLCVPFERDTEAPPSVRGAVREIPDDACIVSICTLWAEAVSDSGTVSYAGDVGLRFIASKKKGICVSPRRMRVAEVEAAKRIEDPTQRYGFLLMSRQHVLNSATGALTRVIFFSKLPMREEPARQSPSSADRLARWEERVRLCEA